MNASTFNVILTNAAGAVQAHIVDFHGLSYTKAINEIGMCKFSLHADAPAIDLLGDKCQILVYRANKSVTLDWYNDWGGLVRSVKRSYTDHDMLEVTALGWLHMLEWRIVGWDANVANRSKFTGVVAETIMKTLVTYNATSSATAAAGRDRDGEITGISVAADTTAGNSIDWECARSNLLTTLQDIAKIGGGDFDLVKTGAQAWEFRWYTGQLGGDRSATVRFSLLMGNMKNPVYTYDHTREKTVALVGGTGQEGSRPVTIRAGADYNASSNNIEAFVNGTQYKTVAGRQAAGDQALENWQARKTLEFDVLQTPACFYGLHYFLGDKVTGEYAAQTATVRIEQVSIEVADDGGETISIEVASV